MALEKHTTAAGLFAKARWIWPDNHSWDLHNGYALFRKKFRLEKIPARALLAITADQSYQLYINGRYVCRGPARGFQKSWPYDEVDVAPYLCKGENVFAVRAYNPGFGNFQYVSQGWAGLLVAAKWGKTEIVSDKSWKCRRQNGLRRDTAPTSLQLFCQEHIDLRGEPPDWMEPGHDDSGWTGTPVEHPWNGMPWYELEPRGIPLLEEVEIAPLRCIGIAEGRSGKDYLATRDLTRTRHAEGLAHREADISVESLTIPPSGKKRFRSYLIDFGRTVVGSMGFEIRGAGGGEIIDTLHVETVEKETLTPHFIPDRHCRMAFGHRLVCRAGEQTHVFYHTFGFRYLVLTVRDSGRELEVRPFLRTTLYPLEQKGGFQSSDAALQRIWETCVWTQRVCSLDAYVDTPWREQAQWWGDARVQAKNTFFYSGDTRLFRRGIAQIAGQSVSNGLTYGHAPTIAHQCILPDFTLVWMITLWDYYWQTGSLEPFESHQGTIFEALNYFQEKTDPRTGLVGYDDRYWLFLDWTGLPREGCSTVYNLWLLVALERLAEMARKARKVREAKALSEWAGRLRKALARLVRPDGLLCDGLAPDGRPAKTASIHSQTLAILAGFQPEQNVARVEKVLLPFIRRERAFEISPSCYWITYVFEVLTDRGYGGDVIEFIRDKWTPMAEHGTTWEVFEPRVGDESFSHAWAAHPLYHLMQIVGGIRQTAPSWDKILFQPVFVGDRATTVVPTPHGKIHSSWERTDGAIKVRLDLPRGLSAKTILPGRRQELVQGKNRWTICHQ